MWPGATINIDMNEALNLLVLVNIQIEKLKEAFSTRTREVQHVLCVIVILNEKYLMMAE